VLHIYPERIGRRFYELFNDRHFDQAEQLVDPYATFHYVPTRQRLIGRAGYRALAAAWVHAFPDAHLDIVSVVADGDAIAITFTGRGTLTGELVLGERVVIAPTGRRAELPFQDRLVIKEGLILESELNFDLEEMKKRLLGE
jgi:predicted ester cyclase